MIRASQVPVIVLGIDSPFNVIVAAEGRPIRMDDFVIPEECVIEIGMGMYYASAGIPWE